MEKTYTLQGGEKIKALKDLKGHSDSFNTPERIVIFKNTILQVPKQGTMRGDVFATVMEGDCKITLRGYCEGQIRNLKPHEKVGLSEGHIFPPSPYSLGSVDLNMWEIIR